MAEQLIDSTRAFRLDGKVALVTGGARGIGAAVCEALAQAGAAVLVTDVLVGVGRETVERMRIGCRWRPDRCLISFWKETVCRNS